jgi:hypothetical protein
MKMLFVVLSALALGACVSTPVEGHVAVYNRSGTPIQVVINGKDTGPIIDPNKSEKFGFTVDIPTGSEGSINDPNSQIVNVSVAVRNTVTGVLSRVTNCTAGAKVVTTITYSIEGSSQYPYENLNCTYT